MRDPLAYSAGDMAALSSRIAEAEMRSAAAAEALTALIKTDTDTTEAEQHFNEAMDALLDLRQQLAEVLLTISP